MLRPRLHELLDRSYEIIDYEEEAPGGRIDQRLTRLITNESDVVIGLVGATYGTPCTFVPPKSCHIWDRPKQPGSECPVLMGKNGYSIVQWEFAKACEHGLYIIPFLKTLQPAEPEPEQQFFVSFLTKIEWVARFSTENDALQKIDRALIDWRNTYWWPNEVKKQKSAAALIGICLGIAVICAILMVFSIVYLREKDPAILLKVLEVLTVPMVVSTGFILLRDSMELLGEQ